MPLAVALTVPTIAFSFPRTASAQPKPAAPAAKPLSLRDSLPLEARGHWDAGVALAQRGSTDPKSWGPARTSFYEAFKISKDPRVLFNVAVCEKNLGRYHSAFDTINTELADKSKLSAADVKDATDFQNGLEKFVVRINIVVDPKDADVFINDEKIELAKPGPYLASVGENRVVGKKAGYADAVQKIELAGGTTGTATLKLAPLERTTIVNVAIIGPQRATVKVDGQEVGFATPNQPFSAPVKVQDTPHQLSVESPGYAPSVQTITVREGAPMFFTMQLAADQAKGKLSIAAKPEGSTIEIDGTVVGATKWEGPVDAKVHQIAVKKTGYYTWTYEVDVPKGAERNVSATLNEDRNTSFVPWLIGTIVVGAAVVVGVVLLATPPDEKPRNGTLDPFAVPTQHRKNPLGLSPAGAGFNF